VAEEPEQVLVQDGIAAPQRVERMAAQPPIDEQVGNLALVVAMLIVAAAWKRDEDARQRRLEARMSGES
jgi:hypothetical protein